MVPLARYAERSDKALEEPPFCPPGNTHQEKSIHAIYKTSSLLRDPQNSSIKPLSLELVGEELND